MDLDVGTATAARLARAIADREISSRELLEELLSRADRLNPALNAIVAFDSDRARAAADAADQATAAGRPGGPLHGLPMTIKDTWETAGLVTTAGAPELAHYVPERDALPVARLKRAGAIVFGKTNTPLYAGDWQTYNEVYGRTNNPWDSTRTTGGSSGGAAAAVAAGLTPLELGSDIGGSIRGPAHHNGVYGLKPSWGVVPPRGHIPGPPGSLSQTDVGVGGPLARSVADLRTALEIVSGPVPEDAAGWRLELDKGPVRAGVRGLRVATVIGDGDSYLPLAADVRAALTGFTERLGAAGARVEAVSMPVPLADGMRTWREIVMPVLGAGMPDEAFAALAEAARQPGDDPATEVARDITSPHRSWLRASEKRYQQRAAWTAFFEDYDAVLAPVLPSAAFPHDTDQPMEQRRLDIDGALVPHYVAAAWMCAIGVVLLPVVTIPVGLTPAGLPVGVQIIGPFLSDLSLLRIAELMDAAAGPGFTPPPLV
jgi:amidase